MTHCCSLVWRVVVVLVLVFVSSLHADPVRIPIRVDVPAGLARYTGMQPFTFGVPFPKGALKRNEALRLVTDEGREVPGQFEVTATWTAAGDDVRWLLVDGFADIRQGVAIPMFLEVGGEESQAARLTPLSIIQEGGQVKVQTGTSDFTLDASGGSVGTFVLKDGEGTIYSASSPGHLPVVEIEKTGPVRGVVKVSGYFTDDTGRSVAQHITRYRFYSGCDFVRIYHTMVWLTDDKTRIAELSFTTADLLADGKVTAGVDGRIAGTDDKVVDLRQLSAEAVVGTVNGKRMDGWIESRHKDQALFLALRWPWQQFPVGVAGNESGAITMRLLSPAADMPMSLKPLDVAVEGVLKNVPSWNLRIFKGGVPGNDVIYNGPAALPHLTPRGAARTWEMLLWNGNDMVDVSIKNTLTQHPVLAFADPAFAVKAELPSPASAYDPQTFPMIEAAIERGFDWYTAERADEGDFGTWNYGDLQWNWTESGASIYRYWMNLGKGWSIVPWALWLRSGDRRYWENGEANSRHAMDVDMCHVPEWERSMDDYRVRGGQYHYSATHWGYGPEVFTYYVDSEFLPYYYYMTGYERARDVMLEHAEGMARWENRDGWLNHFKEDLSARAGRHLYVMVKNTIVLYEATWDPRLKSLADECLDLTLKSQFESGNFPHVKTNHYLDQPLNIAVRQYGWERVGPALERWHRHMGDPQQMTAEGGILGPMSCWSAVNVYRHTGEKRWLDVAAELMHAQAATMDDGQTTWRGLNSIPAHEAGPVLRDWPILMAELGKLKVDERAIRFAPMAAFQSRLETTAELKAAGWGMRHVAMVLQENDTDLELRLTFLDWPKVYRVMILGPDGSVVHQVEKEVATTGVSYDTQQVKVHVPTHGHNGVYTVVVDGMERPGGVSTVHLVSASGKLVHYMPAGQRHFSSPSNAGGFWFRPQPGQTVSIGHRTNRYVRGRISLFDSKGTLLAATSIKGTRPAPLQKSPNAHAFGYPEAEPLQYVAQRDELLQAILPSDGKWHEWFDLKGMEPFISATREEWFDPTNYPHADWSGFQ